MTGSDDLYRLIDSLSMSERRYLRIFSSRHVKGGKNIYLQLFDTIISLREPEDDRLKEALLDKEIRRNLAKHKHYLYNLILRSLNAFHAEHSSEARFREVMRSVEILYQRGLFDQSRKLLRRAARMSEEMQRIPELLFVSDWEQNLLSKTSQYGLMAQIAEDNGKLVAELEQERQIKLLVFKMYDRLLQLGSKPDERDILELRKMMDDPMMNPGNNQRYHIRYLLSVANMLYANAMDDFEGFHLHCNNTVQIFNENPIFQLERPNLFVSALLNQCKAKLQCGLLNEVQSILTLVRDFPKRPGIRIQHHIIANIVYETTHIDLLYSIKQNNLKRAEQVIINAEPDLERHFSTATRSLALSLQFDACYSYFLLGKLDRCLHWLNMLLNDKEYRIRMQLHAVARLFSMVVHFHRGNDSVVDYTARSITLELRNWDFAKSIATLLVRFFTKYPSSYTPKQQKALIEKLIQDLSNLKNKGLDQDVFELFDFLTWAESLRTGKSFFQMLQEKSKG